MGGQTRIRINMIKFQLIFGKTSSGIAAASSISLGRPPSYPLTHRILTQHDLDQLTSLEKDELLDLLLRDVIVI